MQLAAASAALITGCFVGWRKVNAKKSLKTDEENRASPVGGGHDTKIGTKAVASSEN